MLYLVLVVIFIITLYLFSQKRPKNYPPGPYGLPIFGHLLQLGPSPHITLLKLKEKYGPIVAVDFGSYPAIGISDYRILREALAHPSFAGRPNLNVFQHRSRDVIARGLLFTEGRQWLEQRHFAIKQLKALGYSKTSIETTVQAEISDFLINLKADCNRPMSIRTRFHAPVLNILWALIVGERDTTGEAAMLFKICTESIEEHNGLASLCMFIPWFSKIFPKLSGLDEMNKNLGPLWAFFEKYIKDHQSTFIPGQVRDFLDAYIQEIQNTTDPSSSFYKEVGERSMLSTLLDLFFAGGETTANTIHWTCLYLASFPKVQKRLQDEVDSVIGNSRLPALTDEISMPYTCAVIQESMRFTALIPLAIFHSTTQDVELKGYKIPANTMVLMNVYSALHDKEYWGDPEVFRPDRFLDDEGKLIKHEPMVPFCPGKRVCIGEVLARNELFLYITSLFQTFSISTDPANPNPSLDPIVTWIQMPPDHHLMFTQRNS
ncbi:Cytochrome P450 2J6 [Orchesella cincta]|uniref:Cytochrome P450 2J6 n=1 Tax=Orchesella cincta TaxID=48709 RepID=A0A1D2MGX6_ORCCI|nr:Cytochrome P450 2J6 [Orchesella cincta]